MRWTVTTTLALPWALLLAGCDLLAVDPDPRLGVELASDQVVVSPEGSAVVHFVVTNRGSSTAHVSRCGGEILSGVDRRRDGRWVNAHAPLCFTHLDNSALYLEPGESAEGSRSIQGAGTYRLQLWATDGSGRDSKRSAFSPTFTLEEPSP